MSDVKVDVEVLKNEVDNHIDILARLSSSIEKIVDVTNSIGKMLAVHESRLGVQEEITRQTLNIIEERRIETQSKISSLATSIENKLEKITNTIDQITKWKYFVVGGAAVIGFIAAKMTMIDNLFTFVGIK